MENREWKTYLLNEISSKIGDGLHGTPKYDGNGDYYFINGNNLINGSIVFKEDTKTVTEEEFLKYRKDLNDNSVLISINGTIGNLSFYRNEKVVLGKSAAYVNLLDTVDKKFVYYNFKSKFFQNYLVDIATGTTIPNVPLKGLREYEIQLPPLPEQKAIASVLSSLDDKIDLLHQQNQTLEALAETLFRQWFIVEAKEDWEEIKLGELVEIFNGVSYKSDDLNPSTTAMVTLKSFERNGEFRMDGFKEYTGKYKETHLVEEGDLVVAHTDITQDAALIGNPVLVKSHSNYNKLIISMDLVKVVSKNSNFTNEFLYLLMKTREFKEHALGYSNGSTVLHLSKKAIPEFELKLPPNELVNSFTERVSALIKKQFVNQKQIQTLTQLRDTLLPKLMSGEVRVKI